MGSPWSLSTAGCRPRARSRSSCSASASSSWAPASRRSASVSGPTRVASRLRRSDRETRRCCAPSCRSRSSRRRALSHAAAIRAADGGGWRRDWVMAAVSAIPERAPSGTGPESDPELGPAAFQGCRPDVGGPSAQACSLHDPARIPDRPPSLRGGRAARARGVRRRGVRPPPPARRSRAHRARPGDRRGRADRAAARQRHVRADLGADARAPAGPARPRVRPPGLRAQRSARLHGPVAARARRGAGRLDARRPRAGAGGDRRDLTGRDVGAVHGARASGARQRRHRPRHPRRLRCPACAATRSSAP